MDHRSNLPPFTRCKSLLYRRVEFITRALLASFFCIGCKLVLHDHVLIQTTVSTSHKELHVLRRDFCSPASLSTAAVYVSFNLGTTSRLLTFFTCPTTSLHFCQTDRAYPAHGVSSIQSSMHCSYVRTHRHEDVPSFKKWNPRPDPRSQNWITQSIRQVRYSVHAPLSALRVFQASHISLNWIRICAGAHLSTAKAVPTFQLRFTCRVEPHHPHNATSYSRDPPLNASKNFKLRRSGRLQTAICFETQVSSRQKRVNYLANPRQT